MSITHRDLFHISTHDNRNHDFISLIFDYYWNNFIRILSDSNEFLFIDFSCNKTIIVLQMIL